MRRPEEGCGAHPHQLINNTLNLERKRWSLNQKENQVTFFTSNKVSKADRREGDDDKVDGLQCAPALYVLEYDGWQGHEDEAPKQDEEQRGEDADLCLADFPLLQ